MFLDPSTAFVAKAPRSSRFSYKVMYVCGIDSIGILLYRAIAARARLSQVHRR